MNKVWNEPPVYDVALYLYAYDFKSQCHKWYLNVKQMLDFMLFWLNPVRDPAFRYFKEVFLDILDL